jgi:hypothetical protein
MKLIDDRGNLFGAVNIIDALVVLLVVAVVVSGVAFLAGGGDQGPDDPAPTTEPEPVSATVEVVGVRSYVADALTAGPVESEGIVAIDDKSVSPTMVVTEDEAGNLHEREHPQKQTVTLHVTVQPAAQTNETMFGETSLEVGRTATFDFGNVTVEGTFTRVDDTS